MTGGYNERMEYHKLLKVRPNATRDEIKKAYRKFAFHFHPDKGFDDDYFRMIHEAYEAMMKEAEERETRQTPMPPRTVKHDMSFVKGNVRRDQVWAPDFKHVRRPKITVESDQCPLCEGFGHIRNKYKIAMACPRCKGTGHKTRIVL